MKSPCIVLLVLACSARAFAQQPDAGPPDGGPPADATPDGGAPAPAPTAYTPPRMIQRVDLPYPDEAREAQAEGTVVLEVTILANGAVDHVHVLSGPGHGLNETAAASIRASRFEPARSGDHAVPATITLRYSFKKPQTRPVLPVKPVDAAGETLVLGQRDFTAASSTSVRALDLELRPRTTPTDILRVVPGLVLAQHQGGGKADQYFLRGFDADHGTDVALHLDGVPVNMPSHAHGQGYADFHFVIPETVERVDVAKGPYYVEYGDFATAGAINLVTRYSVPHDYIKVEGGSFNTYRVLGMASPEFGPVRSLWAAEVYGTDGPFQVGEGLQRYNVFGKESLRAGEGILSAAFLAYGSQWTSSGQIPLRAVTAGQLDRFGSVDPSEGGSTQRQSVVLAYKRSRADADFDVTTYFIRYKLALMNDFTFFARDYRNGDEIEQDDERSVFGFKTQYRRRSEYAGMKFESTAGVQMRADFIHVNLFDDTDRKRRQYHGGASADIFGTNDDIHQETFGFYLQEDVRFNRYVRALVGLRVDYFNWDVDDRNETLGVGAAKSSGTVQKSLASPKASLVITPVKPLDLFFNFGTGYHSNDARAVVRRPDDQTLPRAIGGEVGVRTRLEGPGGVRLDAAAIFWYLYLQSETVFVGDDGAFESSGSTVRYGGDVEVRLRLLKWLHADFDASLAHSAYVQDAGNGTAVALAPTRILNAGLTARHPFGWRAAVRLRSIGDRPATQDGSLTATGYTVVDAYVGYATRRFEVSVQVENVLNVDWRESQLAADSRLRPTRSAPNLPVEAAPVSDVHFTPGNPVNARAAVTVFF